MKLKYESYMYNEKKIARLTAEPEPYRTNATRQGTEETPLTTTLTEKPY